jgi:hypothetical protein
MLIMWSNSNNYSINNNCVGWLFEYIFSLSDGEVVYIYHVDVARIVEKFVRVES